MRIKKTKKVFLLLALTLLLNTLCAQSLIRFDFRQGSTVLLKEYKQNALSLSSLEKWLKESYVPSNIPNGYVRIIGCYADNTATAINHTATQAATLVSYLQKTSGVKNLRYLFYLTRDSQANHIEVEYIDSAIPQEQNQSIYFTKSNILSEIKKSVERYPATAYLNDGNIVKTSELALITFSDTIDKASQNEQLNSNGSTAVKSTPCNSPASSHNTLLFRHGSETLYGTLHDNKVVLTSIHSIITENQTQIINDNEHIRLTALIPSEQRGNLAALNLASIRASVVRKYLKDSYPFLSDSCFTFFIDPNGKDNAIQIELVTDIITDTKQSEIWYSLAKNDPEKVEYAMSHYKHIPFIDGSERFEASGINFDAINPILDKTVTAQIEGMMNEKVSVTIYYRWDKDNLDKTYLNNTETLIQIDSLLTNENSKHIDSLVIVAYASPEGRPVYNQDLSQRRANTIKKYIVENYPKYKENQIITIARGENWEGFRWMAVADPNLPMKEKVLAIIDNPNIDDVKRQSLIAQLDAGRLYKSYILPNYYRYLRLGASLFAIYAPGKLVEIDLEPIKVEIAEPVFAPAIEPVTIIDTIYRYPIALRTNLLYDVVGALNMGIELPYGRHQHWSLIADVAYAHWHSSKNLYALQTLEYGLENRYWFGASQKRKEQKRNWDQPLKGFYVGVYGKYWQRYDVQFIDGYQGDASWSVGLATGYVIPLSRTLSFDFGIGAGWVSISEYRHYHQPEYNENGKYHLMWQETGRWSGLSLTKVRFALVWLIQTSKTQKRRAMP